MKVSYNGLWKLLIDHEMKKMDPVFDRVRLLYIYSNGFEENLVLNQHL